MTIHKHYNGHARELIPASDLPFGVLSQDFDYMIPTSNDDSGEALYVPRFFSYRGDWYDSQEFERAGEDMRKLGFHAIQGQSYFSAVAIRYTGDFSAVKVGYLHW